MKKGKPRAAKKHLLRNAVRGHARRLRHARAAEMHIAPNHASSAKAEPANFPKDLIDGSQANELTGRRQ